MRDRLLADRQILSQLPEPIVFINAWNVWAEGNHLERDVQWGHGYLNAIASSIFEHSIKTLTDPGTVNPFEDAIYRIAIPKLEAMAE